MESILKGLPRRFESFVVQEDFNPSDNFPELRSRLTNIEDSHKQRIGEEEQQGQHVAMFWRGISKKEQYVKKFLVFFAQNFFEKHSLM